MDFWSDTLFSLHQICMVSTEHQPPIHNLIQAAQTLDLNFVTLTIDV